MAEIRGVIFGPAYESWVKLSQKWGSAGQVLSHLFEVHEEHCKQCRESPFSGKTCHSPIPQNSNLEETDHNSYGEIFTESDKETFYTPKEKVCEISVNVATTFLPVENDVTKVDQVSSPGKIIGSGRRKVKARRRIESVCHNLSQKQNECMVNNIDANIKEEKTDLEPPRSTTDHVDVYMAEEVNDPDSAHTKVKEILVDRIDVSIKQEPEDSDMSNTSSMEVTERTHPMTFLDNGYTGTMSSEADTAYMQGLEDVPQESQYSYIDDGISVDKAPVASVRKKRGYYEQYSPEDKARIARFAIENGIAKAVRHFSKELNKQVRESTVREFKKKYVSQTQGKNVDFLTEIKSKRRGRPKVPTPPKPETPPLPPGQRRKRGEYQKYTPESKATLAKYAIDLGCAKAAKYFSKLMNRHINESTIRSFRKSYLEQLQAKNGGSMSIVERLENKPRGRPKPKPYSTRVIDHLIEYGSFPPKECSSNCQEETSEDCIEISSDLEEGTLNEMRNVLEIANQEGQNQDTQERDSSYPVEISTEKNSSVQQICIVSVKETGDIIKREIKTESKQSASDTEECLSYSETSLES